MDDKVKQKEKEEKTFRFSQTEGWGLLEAKSLWQNRTRWLREREEEEEKGEEERERNKRGRKELKEQDESLIEKGIKKGLSELEYSERNLEGKMKKERKTLEGMYFGGGGRSEQNDNKLWDRILS